ncbi:mechanosensitive ion channel protein MscS [Sulfitobacter sp. SK012]|uniref:mechanosensitive ion channel family protein n=1 Tax=Sulfitobacter sp. SK012 TaxID=1389005 RepID=UPI000E0A3547|nr:mechanosensitive ion channel family protein [Sulfitobacter sp. SK012]AXI45622.1 mechanosensitive ion channel protein MscS [Sulfitobacter sp. SK012]
MHFVKILVLTFLLALPALSPADAQSLFSSASSADTKVTLPDPLTEETANALISRLSDSEVRALLLDQLNTQAVEVDDTATLNDFFFHTTSGAASMVALSVRSLPVFIEKQPQAFATFYGKIGGDGLLKLLGYMAIMFGGAAIAEMIFRRLVMKWQIQRPADINNITLREIISFLSKRFAREIVAVLVFIIVAMSIGTAILPPFLGGVVGLIGPYLIAFPRIMVAVGRFLFAPQNPMFRLLNCDDRTAKAMVVNNFGLAFLIGFSAVLLQFNEFQGVTDVETRIGFWLNLAVHLYLAAVVWKYRAGITSMMRGFEDDITPTEEGMARAFPYFAIVVSLGIWWITQIVVSYGNFELLSSAPHYKTMMLLLFAPAMDTLIRGLVRHLSPSMTGEGPVAERAYISAKRSYIRIGRVVVFGIVIMAIAGFWGVSATNIASAGVGPQLASNLLEFMVIMAIGYLIYELVSLYINRKLAAEQTAAGYMPDEETVGGDGGGAGGSRLSTVLPLILMVTQTTIVVVFLLLGLGNIGVDTTPLLAGAGIAGLAIGFGAQKLVTDVVSGIFFLVDDAFRTGEYVEVEGTMGTVEKISIRSMQLRHHKGPVHTIPYGEIPKVTNFSRDWVIMKLRFTVPFDTDPNMVKKIFKKIGQDMLLLEEFKDDFLQPFKSQGMLEIDDVGMVFRGKFMAKPGTQFTMRKEIFNRVSAAFVENGIEFARREVRVALPSMDGKKLTEEDKSAIAAAATQAAQDQLPVGGQKDDR